jgi:hypothetical protein
LNKGRLSLPVSMVMQHFKRGWAVWEIDVVNLHALTATHIC